MSAATTTTPGTVVLAGDITGSATSPALIPTGVIPGAHFTKKVWVDSKGRILKSSDMSSANTTELLDTASDVDLGIVKVATGNWKGLITSSAGTISAAIATGSVFGQVQGDGTSVIVDGDGTMMLNVADATTSQKGIFKVGAGFSVTAGVLSVPTATSIVKGVFSVPTANGLSVTDGVLTKTPFYYNATSSLKGIASVDEANGFSITAGHLSYTPVPVPDASTSVKGLFAVGAGIDLTTNTISIPDGTTTTLGKVSVTSYGGLTITASNVSFDPSTFYGTSSSKGFLISGTGITNTSGTISIDNAALPVTTTGQKGIMQVGTGLSVTTGTVSVDNAAIPKATTSTLGTTKIGSANTGLANTAGSISTVIATNVVPGVASLGTSLSVAAGVVDVASDVVKTNVANTYTAAQVSSLYTANVSGSLNINPSSNGDNQQWTLTGNLTFTGFSALSAAVGGIYTLILKQDATGSRTLTCTDTNIKWQDGIVPILTTAPNAYDIITFIYLGSSQILALFTPDWT